MKNDTIQHILPNNEICHFRERGSPGELFLAATWGRLFSPFLFGNVHCRQQQAGTIAQGDFYT
jgi:hypothetical protein